MKEFILKFRLPIYSVIIVIIAFITYFNGYYKPNKVFWDENYHIASAQKYTDGVMFMEPHPPLGKMFIALGEVLLGTNSDLDKSKFDKTDYIKGNDFPKEYTFRGVRFFPALFSMLSALLIFHILLNITNRLELSFLFTSLYLFDNALIIHSRSAMLDSIQIFFLLAATLYLTHIIKQSVSLKNYAILGVLTGLAVAVKANSAIALLLFVFLWFYANREMLLTPFENLFFLLKNLVLSATVSIVSIAVIFFGVMYLHIALGQHAEDNRFYKASSEYKEILQKGKVANIANFPTLMKDQYRYMSEYQDGVPKLDRCKKGENGSYALGWPLGNKSINYRWDKRVENGVAYVKYHQLQGNPIVWFSVLLGVIFSFVLIVGAAIFKTPIKDKELFSWILLFTGIYISYFIAILQIDRVMYLYHYFIALIFGMINLALIFNYIFKEELESNSKMTYINMLFFTSLVFFCFYHFSPMTYNNFLTPEEFELRNWFEFWGMKVIQ